MKTVPTTPQTNSTECGIFAAAHVAEIVAGNIRSIQGPFDVGPMRHQSPPGTMSRTTISNSISKGVPWSVWSASQGHHYRCFLARL